jgi:hypothetical protein
MAANRSARTAGLTDDEIAQYLIGPLQIQRCDAQDYRQSYFEWQKENHRLLAPTPLP